MIRALKNHLSLLAIENADGYAKDIRDRMRRRKANAHVSASMNLILLMPHLISRIRDLSDVPGMPKELKNLNGFVLTYLYQPIDFLPDDGLSLLGYLDDAYLVGVVYQHFLNYQSQASVAKGADRLDDISDRLEKVRQILPRETKQIDQMLEELKQGKSERFNQMMTEKNGQENVF